MRLFGIFSKKEKNEDFFKKKLCISQDLKYFIEIEIKKNQTCEEIYNKYRNDIEKKILNFINKSNNDLYFHQQKSKEYFLIENTDEIQSKFKLKLKDKPFNYLKKKSDEKIEVNFFYITDYFYKLNENNNNLNNNNNNLNNNNKNSNINLNQKKTITKLDPQDCIRKGTLNKYSFHLKKFEERVIKLFENRILIKSGDNKNKKITNSGFFYSYLLSEIKSLTDGTNEKEIPLKQNKNIFEIITYDDDKLILKAKNKEDKNDWMISISILASKFKENRLIFQLENKINELNKNNYDDIMKIIFNFFIIIIINFIL